MRRKLRSGLLAAAVMAVLSAVPALAAGWTTNSAGKSVYQNDSGTVVTNSWIKANVNGTTAWYYATSDGSIKTDGWMKINEKYYYFDGSGVMQTGWVDGDNYYCDPSSGEMKTGWKQLALPSDLTSTGKSSADTYWFYFNQRTGEKFHSDGSYVTTKTIDGIVYGFDENGCMATGWAETESGSPEIAGYMYFAESNVGSFKMGQRLSNTWYSTVGPEDDDNSSSNSDLSTGDVEWFYFKSNGHPAAGSSDVFDVEKINGKRYLFNSKGNPVYGIQIGTTSESSESAYYYCGGSKTDCSVRTGKITLTQDDGDKISCYFSANGKGYTGLKNNCIYYNGKMQKADSDLKYQAVTINGKTYVVNSSGSIMKSKKNAKDGDGNKWSTDASGLLSAGSITALELTSPQTTDIE